MNFKKFCFVPAVVLALTMTSCGSGSIKNEDKKSADYASLELGSSFTDLKAKISVVTCRTDLIDDNPDIRDFNDYMAEFNAMYPNIEVSYEGITDYDVDMSTRLNNADWDVCFIPSSTPKSEFSKYFEPFFKLDEYKDKYEFIDAQVYDGLVYGIPCQGNSQGIVYNKRIFEEAGVTEIPKTPDEFIDALHKIKDNTDAIPLYTNYAARWTMGAWDYYCFGGATGNPDYHQVMAKMENPFSEGTAHYQVYSILYRAVAEKLIEDDPYNTNWEMCKARINNGEIACMALGTWAIPQMKDAGDHPDDISYMPFPVTVDGVQYATAAGDYGYGINKKSSDDEKLAAELYVKFMTEKSHFAYDQGCIPIVKGEEYPDAFADFEGVELVKDNVVGEGKTDYYNLVNTSSGLNLESDSEHVISIVDAAYEGTKEFDEIMDEWNEAWSKGQKENNIETE